MLFKHIDLTKFSNEKLCDVYLRLKCWEWPIELGSEPYGYSSLPDYNTGYGTFKGRLKNKFIKTKGVYVSILMEQIEKVIMKRETDAYRKLTKKGAFMRIRYTKMGKEANALLLKNIVLTEFFDDELCSF